MRMHLMTGAAILALAPAFATPVYAQATSGSAADETEVGEVMVTARRREERLRDVPVAASVVDAELVEARGGVSDVQTLLSSVPGLRYFNTSTPANSEISLRASGTSRGTGAEAAVGLYRNGAYIGGGGNLGGRNYSVLDLFDIGRMEVLRGTQGALYGRNAVGGAINVISAQPVQRFTGFVDAKYGITNEKTQLQAVVNVPLSDVVAARFGATYTKQTDGFRYNPWNDQFHDAENGHGLRAQIRYDKDGLDINLLAEAQIATVPGLYWQIYIRPDVASGYPLGLIGSKYESLWDTAPTTKQNVAMVNLSVNKDLGWATVSSTSMYRKRKSLSSFDNDSTNPVAGAAERARGNALLLADTGAGAINQNLAESLYQDLHVASAGESRLSWLGGFELLQIKSDQDNLTSRTPTRANPSPGQRTFTFSKINSISGYGSLGYDLTDRLNVEAEARYTSDTREAITNRTDRATGLPTGARLISNARSEPKNFTYNLTAGFKPVDNWLIYAKYGTSFRAGGFNLGAGDVRQPIPIPEAYNDEKSKTMEVGAKGNILPSVYFTAAAFRSKIGGFIVQLDNGCALTNPACPVSSTSFLTNAGKAETWGIEAELTARYQLAGGDLRIDLSAARTDGEVIEGVYKDRPIPQNSDWNGSATVNYRRPIGGGFTGLVNLNYSFQAGGLQEIDAPFPLYDSGILDVRLGVERGGWSAAVYATNAANFDYIIFETINVRRWNQPRVYGAQLRYKW